MSMLNKVVWSEGMFVRAQHFQQHDQYMQQLLRQQPHSLSGYDYGFYDIRINKELLDQGKVALLSARGVFQDGTPFTMPEQDSLPSALAIGESVKEQQVMLCLPLAAHKRFQRKFAEVQDCYSETEARADIELANLAPILLLESQDRSRYLSLPIAKVIHRRADKKVVLDEHFIAPLLDVKCYTPLAQFISEVQGLLQHRAEVLAARLMHTQQSESAIIADFLLLQLTNRYETIFSQYSQRHQVHPEMLFTTMAELVAEIATYTKDSRRASIEVHYLHDDLYQCYEPLMVALRHSLSMVLEQHAVAISLLAQNYGVYVADINDASLFDHANFILAVSADKPLDEIKQQIPSLLKVASVNTIRDLVSRGLMGVKVSPLAMAPRQIPYHTQFTYFELDKTSDAWKDIVTNHGLALHVAGQFPNLRMELWAVRG